MRLRYCSVCDGWGRADPGDPGEPWCIACDGTGLVPMSREDIEAEKVALMKAAAGAPVRENG